MLSSLPLDKLKFDQSFVRRIDSDHASRAVIDAVIALGQSLGLELVAEGIETESALQYLRERGCQQGQGYYLVLHGFPGNAALIFRKKKALSR